MRRLFIAATACLSLAAFGFATRAAFAAEPVKVSITQIVAHPALDTVRKGIVDYLAENGYKNGDNLILNYQSAQGNITTATQIARQFVGDKPDVIVAIATPSAQTVLAATKEIPIVFSAISDPVAAKLVKSLVKPGGNVTGVSDRSPIEEHVKLMLELKPDTKTIGYLYNAGEANSVAMLKILQQVASEKNLTILPSAAPKSSDVQAATRALIGKVDMIYIPTDNTIFAVLEGAINVANETKTPVFTADPGSVDRGVLAAQGINYYDAGIETGKLIMRILKGEKPGDIDILTPPARDISVNLKTAEKIGLTIPQSILDRAVTKVE